MKHTFRLRRGGFAVLGTALSVHAEDAAAPNAPPPPRPQPKRRAERGAAFDSAEGRRAGGTAGPARMPNPAPRRANGAMHIVTTAATAIGSRFRSIGRISITTRIYRNRIHWMPDPAGHFDF